jgi:hypothetical protein
MVITAVLFWIMQNAIQEKDLNVIERTAGGTLVFGPQVEITPP